MKRIYYVMACLIIFGSCSKKGTNDPAPITVTIDGRAYNTVKIGNRLWTSENFDGTGGIMLPHEPESIYGKLYSWPEAQAIALPAGWRIPTRADFEDLLGSKGSLTDNGVGGKYLDTAAAKYFKSKTNWTISGNNATGFNAEPAGYYNYYMGYFDDTYAYADFWGSTFTDNGNNPTTQITLKLVGYFGSAGTGKPVYVGAYTDQFTAGGELSYSLRFVKDK